MSNAWIFVAVLLFEAVACTKSKKDEAATPSAPITAQQTLSKLIVIADQIEPAFDPFVNSYTLAGGESYKNKISLNTAPVNPQLQIKVNGVQLRSDFTTNPLPLVAGENHFTIDLVDSVGTTVNTYKLHVQRVQDLPDETLADLAFSDGEVKPSFDPDVVSYQLTVRADTSVLTVSPLTNYPDVASLEINGIAYSTGKGGYDVTINPGDTSIIIVVKGKSGRSKTFTVTVTRPAA